MGNGKGKFDAMNYVVVIGFHPRRIMLPFYCWFAVMGETFPRHELKCHLMSCMYETLSFSSSSSFSPFLDPLLFRPAVFPSCYPFRHFNFSVSETLSGHIQDRNRCAKSRRSAEMGHADGNVFRTSLDRARLQENSSSRPLRPGCARDPGAENHPNVEGD